jgi:hypothetical protein
MGPWSRSFIAAVAGNAERPDLDVRALRIEPGVITAEVDDCEVALTGPLIPARIWRSIERFATGMGALEEAVEGKVQSVHLEHLLEEDWSETLIPRRGQITRTCSCNPNRACEHITAAAYAFADELERVPRVLLRWRGVTGAGASPAHVVIDPWRGREVRGATAARRMPKYAVLKRLGSDPALGTGELMQVLRGAYDRLTTSGG